MQFLMKELVVLPLPTATRTQEQWMLYVHVRLMVLGKVVG
jgi:hypothetical protein